MLKEPARAWPRAAYGTLLGLLAIGAGTVFLGHWLDQRTLQYVGIALAMTGFVPLCLRISYQFFHILGGVWLGRAGALLTLAYLVTMLGGSVFEVLGLPRLGVYFERVADASAWAFNLAIALGIVVAFAHVVFSRRRLPRGGGRMGN